MSEEKTMPPSNDWCRFISSSSSSSPSLVPFPFPHVVETGDVLVLGEELGGRLLLQVVRLARLGRHCVPIRWSPSFLFLRASRSLSLFLSGSPPALEERPTWSRRFGVREPVRRKGGRSNRTQMKKRESCSARTPVRRVDFFLHPWSFGSRRR